jgi:hypothetical protein
MLFRHRNLLGKPSKLTIAIAAAGIGVAAAASTVAVTLPGGATAGAAATTAYLRGASVTPAGPMPRSAEQLQANKIQMAQRIHHLAAAKARRAAAAKARRAAAARAAARRAARAAAARQAARRAAHRAAALAAQRQARKAHQAPAKPAAPAQPSGSPQQIAMSMLGSYGWSASQFSCLDSLWARESGWSATAANPDGAYGIPQALPGSKMASAGADWQTNPATQIRWGLGYIKGLYGSPCGAWSHEEATGSY